MLINEKMRLLEKKAAEMIISHSNINSNDILIRQLNVATISKRTFTGVGFFTDFDVPKDIGRANENIESPIGNIYGKINGNIQVGFLLYVNDGIVSGLECYEFGDDAFPNEITSFTFDYGI